MRSSEQIGDLAAAMAKAQGVIKNPSKDKTNPHFKNKYADIADGLECIRPALSAHGIAFFQVTEVIDDGVILTTRLVHAGSGQWIEGTYPVSKFVKHQDMGAALTYARRQALFAIVGVHGDNEDVDGNDATADTRVMGAKPAPAPTRVSDDESAAILAEMQDTLAMCDSPDSVKAWAKANQSRKARLTAQHAEAISAIYRDRLADVSQPIAAE
jgi:hypothetical protein